MAAITSIISRVWEARVFEEGPDAWVGAQTFISEQKF